MSNLAQDVVARCRRIAQFSESNTGTTRTFLCPAMHNVHAYLRDWMHSLSMETSVDAIGNLHGLWPASSSPTARRLLIGSHLDTVPNAGAFDGILGVALAIALVENLRGNRLPFAIQVVGFSEEEGVRFGAPFIGSRAMIGRIDDDLLQRTDEHGTSIYNAIRNFGLNLAELRTAHMHPGAFAYLEFHIEQGPVLDTLNQPLGVVQAIAGQSRYHIRFTGTANHAGTTPMHLRHDALAGAAEWIMTVETHTRNVPDLVATVGAIHSEPQAGNVVPGEVTATLDVRHASDSTRSEAVAALLSRASDIAVRRGLQFSANRRLEQPAVPMAAHLVSAAQRAAHRAGYDAPLMTSGAGHDAMIIAEKIPSVMFFLRSPGGISHSPQEAVLVKDVEAALQAGIHFLNGLATEVS